MQCFSMELGTWPWRRPRIAFPGPCSTALPGPLPASYPIMVLRCSRGSPGFISTFTSWWVSECAATRSKTVFSLLSTTPLVLGEERLHPLAPGERKAPCSSVQEESKPVRRERDLRGQGQFLWEKRGAASKNMETSFGRCSSRSTWESKGK